MLSAVEYRWETWDMGEPDSYSGAPTRDIEEAWDRLWQCKRVRTSRLRETPGLTSQRWLSWNTGV
jgi:hypothetical protein